MGTLQANRRRAGMAALIVALATINLAGAEAAMLHVPGDFPTIQAAINGARNGDKVIVADGVYTGPGNVDLDFRGKAITVRSAGGAAACVIDCNGTPQDPHRGFTFQSGETPESILEGFTILRGATRQGAIDDQFNGAGILVTNGSSPTIRNMVIEGARAGCWGGAICCSHQSSPVIANCTLRNNYSNDDGGALFAWNGSRPTLINALVTGNQARATGGGITLFDDGVRIVNCTIVGNSAPFGAGILDSSSRAVILNSIIRGNTGNQQIWGDPDVTFSNVQGGFAGEGNIDADPLFVSGRSGDFYLSQRRAGQGQDSPCVDAGEGKAKPLGLGSATTRTDRKADKRRVDMGYHYNR